MTNYFICSDISNSIQHTNSTLDNIVASITTDTEKAYFIYAYSLFESTITEIVRYYLKAFPYKIDKNITVNKELVLYMRIPPPQFGPGFRPHPQGAHFRCGSALK